MLEALRKAKLVSETKAKEAEASARTDADLREKTSKYAAHIRAETDAHMERVDEERLREAASRSKRK